MAGGNKTDFKDKEPEVVCGGCHIKCGGHRRGLRGGESGADSCNEGGTEELSQIDMSWGQGVEPVKLYGSHMFGGCDAGRC